MVEAALSCRMSAVLNLVLLCSVVVLQGSAQVWNNYADLPEDYRTHIDKALDEANTNMGGHHHVVFQSLLSTPNIKSTHWHVNVLLKVTECRKDGTKRHRDECVKKRANTPWIDCLVCKKQDEPELIDCASRLNVKNGRDIRKRCQYHTGGGSLLSQKSGNVGTTFGCIGCV